MLKLSSLPWALRARGEGSARDEGEGAARQMIPAKASFKNGHQGWECSSVGSACLAFKKA